MFEPSPRITISNKTYWKKTNINMLDILVVLANISFISLTVDWNFASDELEWPNTRWEITLLAYLHMISLRDWPSSLGPQVLSKIPISLISPSASSCIFWSRIRRPKPRFFNVVNANRLWNLQISPSDGCMPINQWINI